MAMKVTPPDVVFNRHNDILAIWIDNRGPIATWLNQPFPEDWKNRAWLFAAVITQNDGSFDHHLRGVISGSLEQGRRLLDDYRGLGLRVQRRNQYVPCGRGQKFLLLTPDLSGAPSRKVFDFHPSMDLAKVRIDPMPTLEYVRDTIDLLKRRDEWPAMAEAQANPPEHLQRRPPGYWSRRLEELGDRVEARRGTSPDTAPPRVVRWDTAPPPDQDWAQRLHDLGKPKDGNQD